MKKCTYCGQEYPDEANVCAIDSKPLETVTVFPAANVRPEVAPLDVDGLLHNISGIAKVVSGNPMAISHLPAISSKETQFGVCLVWKCPRCEDLRDFRLVEGEVNVSMLGLNVANLGKLLDLRCDGCGFELKVNAAEQNLVANAAELTKSLKEGRIKPDTYVTEITNLPARFVKDIIALTQNWRCPTCGEENPMTFDCCWNCSSKASTEPEIPDDAKPFPGVPRGGNAWE